ncbi:Protein Networked (NET), actin-binding (NAB) domain [Dillenia turbinata]|uniref:Protein Networked (NET), actin-binding (NAB) domain n=1 Tax=Dillenia turbinata TaxID=194707 RepID=A0AAN8V0B1_9MAGN
MDERMKMLSMNFMEEENADTFAERAESYYQKRPQLLSLLQDLYMGYQTLADRYCQTLAKHHHIRRLSSQISYIDNDYLFAEDYDTIHDGTMESDVESSLSFQPMKESASAYASANATANANVNDEIVAELVMKTVEYEIMAHEIGVMEGQFGESSRKMELQKSLLEVLESERLILLTENARLGYRVAALAEENEGLAAEAALMKRKAGELARCVLKMRDDHRVCMLSRKIEDLQAQIYGLEKRNKDYCDRLVDKNNKNPVVKEGNGQSGCRGGGRMSVVMKGDQKGVCRGKCTVIRKRVFGKRAEASQISLQWCRELVV